MKCNLYFLFGFYWNLHPILKGKLHIFLAVDRHKIHHGVPGSLVKIIHLLRQVPQLLQPRLRRFKPPHQGIIAFCVFTLALRDAGVFPDAFLYQLRRHVHLSDLKCRVPDFLKACKDAGLLIVDGVQRIYEKLPDDFLVQMWCGAFLPSVKLMIALPNYLLVFIIGIPDLGGVPSPAVPAADFAGENAHAAIPAVPFSRDCINTCTLSKTAGGMMVSGCPPHNTAVLHPHSSRPRPGHSPETFRTAP